MTWSRLAIADRDSIFDYLVAESPTAAVRIDRLIEQTIDRLPDFPAIGRAGRIDETRELVIVGTRYVAAYRIEPGYIRILRILDGARQWPDMLDPSGSAPETDAVCNKLCAITAR